MLGDLNQKVGPRNAIKFGGVPMSTPALIKVAVNMVRKYHYCEAVIVSAPGRNNGSRKVTDLLIACYEKAKNKEDFSLDFKELVDRFEKITDEFELPALGVEMGDLQEYLNDQDGLLRYDYVVSRGEYFMAIIMSKLLNATLAPVEDLISIDNRGIVMPASYRKIEKFCAGVNGLVVFPGFYGSDVDGEIKILDRGGSDITAAIVARALKVDRYFNVKDVPGVAWAHPKFVGQKVRYFEKLSFRMMLELSSRGAEVLHPRAITPVEEVGIPIVFISIYDPDVEGTTVTTTSEENAIGLAGYPDCFAFRLYMAGCDHEVGFGKRAFDILSEKKISFNHLATGEQDILIVIAKADLAGYDPNDLVRIFKQDLCKEVDVFPVGVISIVSEEMAEDAFFLAKIVLTIAQLGCKVRLLSDGGSRSIILGVEPEYYERAVEAIYLNIPK